MAHFTQKQNFGALLRGLIFMDYVDALGTGFLYDFKKEGFHKMVPHSHRTVKELLILL